MGISSYLPTMLSNIWLYGVLFLLVLTLVIFVHEMGHYLAARFFKIRAEIFSLGFGPELIGRTDKRGTRWSLRLYPIGGYVRMFGAYETQELRLKSQEELKSAYFLRPVYQRAVITAAGPAINFIFGILLLAFVYTTLGRPSPEPYIAALEAGSPAQQIGLHIGDVFLKIDGKQVDGTENVKDAVAGKTGKDVQAEIRRDNQILIFHAVPKELRETNSYGFPTSRGYLGAIWPNYGFDLHEVYAVDGVDTRDNIDLARKLLIKNFGREIVIHFGNKLPNQIVIFVREDLNQALKDPAHKDYDVLTLGKRPTESMKSTSLPLALSEAALLAWKATNQTLGTIFQVITGTKKTTELGGVIKISKMTGKMAGQGIFMFLSFIAILSVNIGMVNLLPIPMLDGGHLMFQAAEAFKGSPVSLTAKGYTYGFGLVFLILTMVFINVSDIIGLFKHH